MDGEASEWNGASNVLQMMMTLVDKNGTIVMLNTIAFHS